MKKRPLIFILGAIFLVVSACIIYDIGVSYGEFDQNRDKIRIIEDKQQAINQKTNTLRYKKDRFVKDPRAAEELLRLKYKMMPDNQFKIKNTPEK